MRQVEGSFTERGEITTSRRGDEAVFNVQGRAFAWVATKGPKRGVADIYVDRRLKATVSLRAPTIQRSQAVHVQRVSTRREHRVVIVNRSRQDRPIVGLETILVQGSPRSR